jgi:hypothetical protein
MKDKKTCVLCGQEFLPRTKRSSICPSCYNKRYRVKQPKRCLICGLEFIPRTLKSQTCGKLECRRAYQKEKSQKLADEKTRLEFSKGRIWLLDIEHWRWIREERGIHG